MIFTECIKCNESIIVPLENNYINILKEGKQLISKEICANCGTINYVEHKKIGGETFGETDKRALMLKKL